MKKFLFVSVISLAMLGFCEQAKADWCGNMRSSDVWYSSSGTVSIGREPIFSMGYTKVTCCVNGSDMDACNNGLEAPECSQKVVRTACTPPSFAGA